MKLILNEALKVEIQKNFIEAFYAANPDFFLRKYASNFQKEENSKTYSALIAHNSAPIDNNSASIDNNKKIIFQMYHGSRYYWSIYLRNVEIKNGSSIVDLYSSIFSIVDPCHSIKKLSKDLEIDFEIDFDASSCSEFDGLAALNRRYLKFIPYQINFENRFFVRKDVYEYRNCDNSVSGLVAKWVNNDDYFELPLFYRPIVFDFDNMYAFFLWPRYSFKLFSVPQNFNEFNSDVIILCEDFILSEELNKIICDSKRINFNNFCCVSFSYVSKSCIENNLSFFKNKNVVFVPNYFNSSESDLQTIKKLNSITKSLKIQKNLIFYNDGSCFPVFSKSLTRFDDHLIKSAIILNDFGSSLIFDINRTSVSYDEYLKWGEYIGIFNSNERVEKNSFYKFKNKHLLSEIDFLRPSFDSLLGNSNFTLVYGAHGASKSLFLITVMYALSSDFEVFGINVVEPKKTLFVDFSSSSEAFENKLYSIHIPYKKNNPISNDFSVLLMSEIDLLDKYDFTSDYFQSFIENHILESRCEVIAFDNYPFRSSDGDLFVEKWEEIFRWLGLMRNKYGVGIVFCYETFSEEDNLLCSLKKHQFSNIIKVDKLSSETFVSDKNFEGVDSDPGIVINIQYEYVQSLLRLGKSSFYHKSFTGNMLDSKWKKISHVSNNESNREGDSNIKSYENIVLQALKLKKINHTFKRKEIDLLLGRKSGTSRIVLNELISKKIIKKIGDHPRSVEYKFKGENSL